MKERNDEIALEKSSLIERLNHALKSDGDFPTSAKIVVELRRLTADPNSNAQQIAEVILREPSLGARVLHLVNSSFYHRGRPILTISQAVLRLGMKQLAELCAGLVLLRKFSTLAGRGNIFGHTLTQTIITSLVSAEISKISLAPEDANKEESGYLCGSMLEIGVLLLAFYFPDTYEKIALYATENKIPFSLAFRRKVGISQFNLSAEIIRTLGLPDLYHQSVQICAKMEDSLDLSEYPEAAKKLANIVFGSHKISECISRNLDSSMLDSAIKDNVSTIGLEKKLFEHLISQLPETFLNHCLALEVKLPPLPEYIKGYSTIDKPETKIITPETSSTFSSYLEEIRSAVEHREPTSAILATVLETLSWGLKFDRAVLMFASGGKRILSGRMALGDLGSIDPKSIERRIDGSNSHTAEAKAFFNSELVFTGEPIFNNGWPFVCIPVGFGNRSIGIIYADRIDKGSGELDVRERASLEVVAELLDRALSYSSTP